MLVQVLRCKDAKVCVSLLKKCGSCSDSEVHQDRCLNHSSVIKVLNVTQDSETAGSHITEERRAGTLRFQLPSRTSQDWPKHKMASHACINTVPSSWRHTKVLISSWLFKKSIFFQIMTTKQHNSWYSIWKTLQTPTWTRLMTFNSFVSNTHAQCQHVASLFFFCFLLVRFEVLTAAGSRRCYSGLWRQSFIRFSTVRWQHCCNRVLK